MGTDRSMLPPGETRPLLLHLPHLPDGVLYLLQRRLFGKCCGQYGMCCFLERQALFCYTVILWSSHYFLVWQVLEGGWCLLPPRELFVLQVLGPVVVPPPEEHDAGTLLLDVGRGIMAIDEA